MFISILRKYWIVAFCSLSKAIHDFVFVAFNAPSEVCCTSGVFGYYSCTFLVDGALEHYFAYCIAIECGCSSMRSMYISKLPI